MKREPKLTVMPPAVRATTEIIIREVQDIIGGAGSAKSKLAQIEVLFQRLIEKNNLHPEKVRKLKDGTYSMREARE